MGGDRVAHNLLEPPREAHLVAVKLSNDRLTHRRRDAEFRALSHVAGVLRNLLPEADELMSRRIMWGDYVEGWFRMYVTEVPCLSCIGAMVQFTKRFPRVNLRVTFASPDASTSGAAAKLQLSPNPLHKQDSVDMAGIAKFSCGLE